MLIPAAAMALARRLRSSSARSIASSWMRRRGMRGRVREGLLGCEGLKKGERRNGKGLREDESKD